MNIDAEWLVHGLMLLVAVIMVGLYLEVAYDAMVEDEEEKDETN